MTPKALRAAAGVYSWICWALGCSFVLGALWMAIHTKVSDSWIVVGGHDYLTQPIPGLEVLGAGAVIAGCVETLKILWRWNAHRER